MSFSEGVRRVGISLGVVYWCGAALLAAGDATNAKDPMSTFKVRSQGRDVSVEAYSQAEANEIPGRKYEEEEFACRDGGISPEYCVHSSYFQASPRQSFPSQARTFGKDIGIAAIIFAPLLGFALLFGWITRGFASSTTPT